MKKLLLILMVAFHLITTASVASAIGPWPECYPCDDKRG
jgi:hypothetical protein